MLTVACDLNSKYHFFKVQRIDFQYNSESPFCSLVKIVYFSPNIGLISVSNLHQKFTVVISVSAAKVAKTKLTSAVCH